jgi:hypothetical protein
MEQALAAPRGCVCRTLQSSINYANRRAPDAPANCAGTLL